MASAPVGEVLRAVDPVRYAATLYAPEAGREALAAIWAFDAEIASIPRRVSEPMPGEIRLQWWREVISGERAGEAAANPVAQGLFAAIRTSRLPRSAFDTYLDARVADLYHDPFPDTVSFEAWCGETSGAITQMAVMVLAPGEAERAPDAAGHAGCVLGAAAALRDLAANRRRRKVTVPLDILASCGLDAETFPGGTDARHEAAVSAMVAFGRDHFSRFAEASVPLTPACRAAFLPLEAARRDLEAAERDPRGCLDMGLRAPSLFGVHWRLLRRAMSGWN